MGADETVKRRGRPSTARDSVLAFLEANPGLAVCEISAALNLTTQTVRNAVKTFQSRGLIAQDGVRHVPRLKGLSGVLAYPGWRLVGASSVRHVSRMNSRDLGYDVHNILLGLGRAKE